MWGTYARNRSIGSNAGRNLEKSLMEKRIHNLIIRQALQVSRLTARGHG
ncbi:MAG: hypothetical protein Q7J09_05925 [Methanocalculus sp.]|nr:hypothetical protein [Methanocalculus sp.]MDO9539525.1 hypothetical protein [Methanocalculus sp.]